MEGNSPALQLVHNCTRRLGSVAYLTSVRPLPQAEEDTSQRKAKAAVSSRSYQTQMLTNVCMYSFQWHTDVELHLQIIGCDHFYLSSIKEDKAFSDAYTHQPLNPLQDEASNTGRLVTMQCSAANSPSVAPTYSLLYKMCTHYDGTTAGLQVDAPVAQVDYECGGAIKEGKHTNTHKELCWRGEVALQIGLSARAVTQRWTIRFHCQPEEIRERRHIHPLLPTHPVLLFDFREHSSSPELLFYPRNARGKKGTSKETQSKPSAPLHYTVYRDWNMETDGFLTRTLSSVQHL